ncbi:MAG: PH domain-containing protein [Halobacteriota archaeon]
MSSNIRDDWDYPQETKGITERSPASEFAVAVNTLDRLSDKVQRFYQSGDFEEVVLNAHQIKELYQLCLRDEYKRHGRNTFRQPLRAHIETKLDSLDYWWEAGVVAFQKIKIGPEIAKGALTLSGEMRDYMVSYVEYSGDDVLRASQVTNNRSSYEAQVSKKPVVPLSSYPVRKGGIKIEDDQLLYLSRPSILGCSLAYKWVVLLLVALLFGSFFVNNITDVSLIASLLRGISLLLFLFVAAKIGLAVYSERYAITDQDICVEKGLLFKSTATLPLVRIAAQMIQQSTLDKLLKTGNLIIKTHSRHIIAFRSIYDPRGVFELVADLRKNRTPYQD